MKREKGTGMRSWELTDELWEAVKALVPEHRRDENRTYSRKPGGGRKPIPPRRVLEGIFYVLRTGVQWKALPKEYGAASSIHQYFSEWAEAGFFLKMWQEGLITYEELKGLGWEWQSADGSMVKAPLAREGTGKKRDQTEYSGRVTRITGKYRAGRSQPA
ncbi:MAG: transposase [Treponema sp.]|jgi:transposase|nr:transposase [Treponema sp.]